MTAARLNRARLTDVQQAQSVEELDTTGPRASLLMIRRPSTTADRHETTMPLLLRACTDSTPQHNERHTTPARQGLE